MPSPITCRVETTLTPAEIFELDGILADPGAWPKSIWGILRPAALTPAARRWGAAEMGAAWFVEHGHPELDKRDALRHYKAHVPILAGSIDELALLASDLNPGLGNGQRRGERGIVELPKGAMAIMDFYSKAIRLGAKGLGLLEKRVDAYVDNNEQPPPDLLLEVANLGAKLATSAATLALRGASPLGRDDDVWDGARDPVGPRVGHSRERLIDGEHRFVHDEGPADREHYAERARMEGRESPF